ncbi:hypothetical protein LCGC14_1040560 [marine sediment metagenome]|uniref:Uncharacterized protein n=1 Tax=marine sediment metagenome TaxID=412755 RepID=A0A0F9QA36_9ZZZZ|nr:hypothetical protein [bacterium]
MVENNNDFLKWEVKPVWVVSVKSEITGIASEYDFEILGLNRSAGDINRNWEKVHSVEQFNQGRVAKPSDFTITIALKENGNPYEAMRRVSKGGIEFDIRCDLINDVSSHADSPTQNIAGKSVWMKGFEKFIGCVVMRESQTIEIAEFPVREFECDALRHEIMGIDVDGTSLDALIEGDGTYPMALAYEQLASFIEKSTSE